ncbi:MAG: hypothetical protein HY318_05275, partial [Armatimonadetes bacterium]|nr:hypothetical protein [Armatimonadota bacterium]
MVYPNSDTIEDWTFWGEVLERFTHEARLSVRLLDSLGDWVSLPGGSKIGKPGDCPGPESASCPHHNTHGARLFHRVLARAAIAANAPMVRTCPAGLQCLALPVGIAASSSVTDPTAETGGGMRGTVLVTDCYADDSTEVEAVLDKARAADFDETQFAALRERLDRSEHLPPDPTLLAEILQRIKQWVALHLIQEDLDFGGHEKRVFQRTVARIRNLAEVDGCILASLERPFMPSSSATGRRVPGLASRQRLATSETGLRVVAAEGCENCFNLQGAYLLREDCIERSVI